MTLLAVVGLAMLGAAGSPAYTEYEKANHLFAERKFQECLVVLDHALRLDPKLLPAWTLKAKLALTINRFDVAEDSLQHALQIDSRSAYAQFLFGMEAYLRNDLRTALPRFLRAHQLDERDARANLYLGLTNEALGKSTEALSYYSEAIRLEQVAGMASVDTLLPYGRLLLLLDRNEDAGKAIRAAIAASPKSRDAHFDLARLLLKHQKPAQAAEQGELALSLSDGLVTDTQIHYLLIRAFSQSGNAARAEQHAGSLRALERR